MTRSYTRYPMRFRERAVERMRLGENVSQLARELGVDRSCLYAWKRKSEGRRARKAPQHPESRTFGIGTTRTGDPFPRAVVKAGC
jgi:transposase-like protein